MNDKTITLFNYHAKSKTWHKTVIRGVSYRYGSERTVASSGAIVFTQLLTVIIPVEADTNGKEYIDAGAYSGMRGQAADDFWTINPMKNSDVIVCGEIDKKISDTYTITDLQKDFQKSGTVCSLSDNTDVPLLKHYKVVCK